MAEYGIKSIYKWPSFNCGIVFGRLSLQIKAWFYFFQNLILDKSGKIIHMKHEILSMITDYSSIVLIDKNDKITFLNNTAERLFRIPAHEALGHYVLDIIPHIHIGKKMIECLKTGLPFHGEELIEGGMFICNINPIETNGKVSEVVGVFHDISRIEALFEELNFFKNAKKWLDAVIESSFDGLSICDSEGKIIQINKALEAIIGLKREEVIGKNVKELVAKRVIDKSVALEVLEKKTSVTMIQKIRGEKTVLITGNPIFDNGGKIAYVVINDRDISALDNLRNQLQESQALARKYSSRLSELEMKRIDFSNIIFRSEAMERIIEMAIRVAKVDSTVFLLGESGVGKGMIAKLVHNHSDRRTGPYIRVDCAGIPDSLIESELFGYERGAFTGARTEGKPGLFELANNGSLFLDEIGEIPLGCQAKLLHFLEDREIVRVGGTDPKKIDVRIIAATNRNIDEMVLSKLFRKDLYYRLNVVPIWLPPLRNRRDDIFPLVLHFLEKFNSKCQKKKVFSPDVMDALCNYDFPGNIRELANICERLVVMTKEERVEKKDLPDTVGNALPSSPSPSFPSPVTPSLAETLEKYEAFIIKKALEEYGSQHEAAKALKVNQGTISRKLKKYYCNKRNVKLHKAMN